MEKDDIDDVEDEGSSSSISALNVMVFLWRGMFVNYITQLKQAFSTCFLNCLCRVKNYLDTSMIHFGMGVFLVKICNKNSNSSSVAFKTPPCPSELKAPRIRFDSLCYEVL